MSVTSVVNLTDGLLGQPATQETHDLLASTTASSSTSLSALPQDEFVPSSLADSADSTAQAAGLFSAPNTSALPSSGTSLLATPTVDATQSNTEAADATSSASGSNAQASATSQIASPSAAPDSATSTSSSSSSVAPGSIAQQTQLNTLNNALAALGLSAADIQQIDRVASLINDFNPTAFTSLAYQLEAQAQNSAAQNSAVAQVTQAPRTTTATPPAAQTTSAPAAAASSNAPQTAKIKTATA